MRKQACLAMLMLALSPLLHAFDLAPYTATYHFNLDNKVSGSATRTLEKRGDGLWRYVFSATAPIATASETSDFRFDGQQVTSLGYLQQRKIFFSKKKSHVDFDWKNRKGTGAREGKPSVTFPLQPGALDGLNMEIQIRRDLMETGKLDGPYSLASPKGVSPLTFVVEGSEVVDTPFGKINTLKVSRKHDDPKRRTIFWLAKDLDYLPAKVTQDDDGALYILELTGITPRKGGK